MANEPEKNTGPEFAIQRLYAKGVSLEAPNVPGIFGETWEPSVAVDLQSQHAPIEKDIQEVVLTITVTVHNKEKVAFLAEVQQAGIFTTRGFESDQLKQLLGSFCPNILYPYAREAISDLVARGGFPQLYLAPINFDAVYQQQLQKEAKPKEGEEETKQ